MNALIAELTVDEAQECSRQLQQALEAHIQWLTRLHQSLICHTPPLPADLAEDAHHRCSLGQWYDRMEHPSLRNNPEFAALGEVHRKLHLAARDILLNHTQDHPVSAEAYTTLLDRLGVLRQKIYALGLSVSHNLGLVSKLADKIFENASEGVLITDQQGTIVNVNRSFSRMTGYSRKEAVGKTPSILNSGRQDSQFYRAMWQSLRQGGHWEGEIWNRRKNGEVYLEWLSISAVRNDNGEGSHYIAIFSDITHARENEKKLHHLAYYDPLTDLPNRVLFHDRMDQALARSEREGSLVALLFLDLDRFKGINDMLGHKAGDRLLMETANRLKHCMRSSDTVARLSGDEFTVIVSDLENWDGAARVAQKIIDALAIPYFLEGREVFITTSIGIGLYPSHGETAEALVKAADQAMYQAKEHGRNNYQFFRGGPNDSSIVLFALEHGLRRAIERDQLQVLYQPQVDLESGSITGTEALLRWNHPERGVISPVDFIPLAEETGLIIPIGEWVLRQACMQNMRWARHGFGPLRMAVNLSALQLKQPNFAEKVAEILDDTGMDPELLELELTETMVMQNAGEVLGILRQLKSLGIHISIDDFGTGYSSLAYLKRFPINTVKIDKSFIQGVTNDFDDAAISQAIIALAHSLKLRVVAEGVETTQQLGFLREHNCCDAQGFLFSRPLAPEAVESYMAGQRQAADAS
jgi:diguanylate cyclase (GGDEF)-like protein/PAS domain S-box-containing protein